MIICLISCRVAENRIDHKLPGMSLKSLLETISICLNMKDDFRSDIIREAITTLLEDEVPSILVMRTASICSVSMPEIQRFIMTYVIPKLVSICAWEKAPKVWDGVAVCLKRFAQHRDNEPAIRALINIPADTLKLLIKEAPQVKVPINKLLTSLSHEEFEGLIVGFDEVQKREYLLELRNNI
jgi:hypothetical protein